MILNIKLTRYINILIKNIFLSFYKLLNLISNSGLNRRDTEYK